MKTPIIILHGWGLHGKRYSSLQTVLEKNGFTVFSPDFPGFGSEPLKKPVMTLDDYVAFLFHFYQTHHITKAILIGHSFGGRVAAKFSIIHPSFVEKLIVSGTPLIRPKLSLKRNIVQNFVKKGTVMIHFTPKFVQSIMRWLIYRFIGEWDYYKAQNLKETFKAIINEDAASYIARIHVPTLLLWGEKDSLVPVTILHQIHSKVPGSKKVIITQAGHGLPYALPDVFAQNVLEFLEK